MTILKNRRFWFLLLLVCIVVILPSIAAAADEPKAGFKILDNIIETFESTMKQWGAYFQRHAYRLFWVLAVIGLFYRFIPHLFRWDFANFINDLCHFLLYIGFFYFLIWMVVPLRPGYPPLIESIVKSFTQLGSGAPGSNASTILSPSSIVGIGLDVVSAALRSTSIRNIGQSTALILVSFATAAIFVLIAANMSVVLVQCWLTAYAGVIYLGFAGISYTKDIAINYLKSVVAMGAKLMSYTIIIGVGRQILLDACAKVSSTKMITLANGKTELIPETVTTNTIGSNDLLAVSAIALLLLVLSQKIPDLISGLISGASIHGMSGGITTGTAMSAGQSAAALATGGTSAIAVGAGVMSDLAKQTAAQSQAGEGILFRNLPGSGESSILKSFAKAKGTDGIGGMAGYGASFGLGYAKNALSGLVTTAQMGGQRTSLGTYDAAVQLNTAREANRRSVDAGPVTAKDVDTQSNSQTTSGTGRISGESPTDTTGVADIKSTASALTQASLNSVNNYGALMQQSLGSIPGNSQQVTEQILSASGTGTSNAETIGLSGINNLTTPVEPLPSPKE